MKTSVNKQCMNRLLALMLGLSVCMDLQALSANADGDVLAVVTVGIVTPMSFGTIYARGNGAGANATEAVDGAAVPNGSAYIDLGFTGTRTAGIGGGSTATMLAIPGGAPQAASFTVTGLADTLVRLTSPLILDADNSAGLGDTTTLTNGSGDTFLLTDIQIDTDDNDLANNDTGEGDHADVTRTNLPATVWGKTTNPGGTLLVEIVGRLYTTILDGSNKVYDQASGAYSGTFNIIISY